jgi:ATP phosphoribosyltransferase
MYRLWQGRLSNGIRRSRSIVLELDKEELQKMKLVLEQLQENIITFLDDKQGYEIDSLIIDNVCQVVVETFRELEV